MLRAITSIWLWSFVLKESCQTLLQKEYLEMHGIVLLVSTPSEDCLLFWVVFFFKWTQTKGMVGTMRWSSPSWSALVRVVREVRVWSDKGL